MSYLIRFSVLFFSISTTSIMQGVAIQTVKEDTVDLYLKKSSRTEPSVLQVITPIYYTYGAKAVPLEVQTKTSNQLMWYTVKSGGVGSTIAPTPSTQVVGRTKYWVSQRNADGIEGGRAMIEVVTGKAHQQITFNPLDAINFDTTKSFYIQANSTSSLPVTFETVNNHVATIDRSGFVRLNCLGEITILATQPGNRNYHAAKSVVRVIKIESTLPILEEITIGGRVYRSLNKENTIRIYSSEHETKYLVNNVRIKNGGLRKLTNYDTIYAPRYGDYTHQIEVVSPSGAASVYYTFTIERRPTTELFSRLDTKTVFGLGKKLAAH